MEIKPENNTSTHTTSHVIQRDARRRKARYRYPREAKQWRSPGAARGPCGGVDPLRGLRSGDPPPGAPRTDVISCGRDAPRANGIRCTCRDRPPPKASLADAAAAEERGLSCDSQTVIGMCDRGFGSIGG